MQNKEERKVLLQISNLKQYFPVGKKGMFVKANDGISIDIYEGETFGLVGESGKKYSWLPGRFPGRPRPPACTCTG